MTIEEDQEELYSSYELYKMSEKRARSLLRLQDGINILMESEGDFIGYFTKKMTNSSYAPQINRLIGIYKKYTIESSMAIQVDNVPGKDESEEIAHQIEDVFTEIGKEGLEELFKPIIEIIEAVDTIQQSPLYHEAVVSSVTSFEAYLKDILTDLIVYNDLIEGRFSEELKPEIPYQKMKECDFDKYEIIKRIVVDKFKFFNLDEVEGIFRRTFGNQRDFSIFIVEIEKNELKKYFELRHIIVHNGGYVDNKFKRNTQCPQQVGEFFEIESEYIERMMDIMVNIVNKIEQEIEQDGYNLEDESEE